MLYFTNSLFGNPSQILFRENSFLSGWHMYDLRVLGSVQVLRDGAPVHGFESRKALALLCYLALRGQPVSRAHLADLLWGDKTEAHGRGNLSRVLNNLSHFLPGSLQTGRDDVRLERGSLQLDLSAFEELTTRGDAESLAAAAELYRDEFMAGLQLDDCPDFEIWMVTERERCRQQVASVLECLVGYHTRRSEFQKGLLFASRLLALEPWREMAHRQLMLLLALTGQRTAALAQYESCRRLLAAELGVEPSKETTALYEQIRTGEIVSPAMRTLTPSNTLPAPLTSFVGREAELAAIDARLANPVCRLLTLIGAGGIGKTRLALEAAARKLDTFRDGVFFVPLAPLNSPQFIVPAIADALKFTFAGPEDPQAQLLNFLTPKQMLLVLDNFEHLLSRVEGSDGARVVVDILTHAPNVIILATSREPLNLQAEWLLHIKGLPFPTTPVTPLPSAPLGTSLRAEWTGERLETYGAVQLFVERAAQVDERFALNEETSVPIVPLCQLVEGMPLAIELAAAWVSTWSVDAIAQHIAGSLDFLRTTQGDVDARHRSLRAVLDWSYTLLSDAQQMLLRWLSVFAGGWILIAAEMICAGRLPEDQVLDLLTLLENKSLVVAERGEDEERYHLLQPVREYAHDKLVESGDAKQAQTQHLAFFLNLAEQAEPQLTGPQSAVWLTRLEAEHDNLRAALAWSLADEANGEMSLRLAGTLWRFWYMRGYFTEGRDCLEAALNRNDHTPSALQAKALTGAGYMAWCQGDYERAVGFHERALTLYQEVGDKWGIAFSLHNLGAAAVYQGDDKQAEALFEESLSLARGLGDKWLTAVALIALGELARLRKDYQRARARQGESLALARETGDRQIIALSLNNLALVATAQGDLARAAKFHTESLGLYRDAGERRLVLEGLEGLAEVLSMQRHPEEAARLLGAAEALRENIHHPLPTVARAGFDRTVATVLAQLVEPLFAAARAEGRAMTMEQAVQYALELGTQAEIGVEGN
jgi:predicted ATPase/DNA-binding SARP family transcriptional activator